MTGKLVTIAIPIYKRLSYLPGVLKAVEAQDYQHIELIVSDNGKNGSKMTDIIEKCYSRPVLVRQTTTTVNIPSHYHQCLSEATGEYFVWLADDDLISANFVSELMQTLEAYPEARVAIAHEEMIDRTGRVVRRSSREIPSLLSGADLIRSWSRYQYENWSTLLARKKDLIECGGYAHTPWGTASDDLLLMKLCFKGPAAFNQRCTFQWRWDETGFGYGISIQQLAEDHRCLFELLETDPVIMAFKQEQPALWAELKHLIMTMTWGEYFHRWNTMYRKRLSLVPWAKSAFGLPFPPEYYRMVRSELWYRTKETLFLQAKSWLPWIYRVYQTMKTKSA
jgi:glycosyltransferase involved in cell wall biosynthesis